MTRTIDDAKRTIDNAHKTAIKRKKLSAPADWLVRNGYIQDRTLDYGCGRGGDADRIGCEGYDPYYRPEWPEGLFETVMSNFVLNVIEDEQARRDVLKDIDSYVHPLGRAYIAVRNDRKELKGETRVGTWQGLITLDLPVVHKGAGYTIYVMRSGQSDCEMTAETF